MRRLAHQAFQISAWDAASNGIGLRGFSGVAAASDHSNALPYHDPDVHSRWTADQFAVDKFWGNRLETEVGSNLRDTWLRRVDLPDLGRCLLDHPQARSLVETFCRVERRAAFGGRVYRVADEILRQSDRPARSYYATW